MRNTDNDFAFSPNYNFGVDNLLVAKNNEQGSPFPPATGFMLYQDGQVMDFQDNTAMLYQ